MRNFDDATIVEFFVKYSFQVLGGIIVFVWLIKQKNYKLIIFISLFIACFVITGRFWYGGLYGRWSALVAYPLALFLALLPWRRIYWGLILVLIRREGLIEGKDNHYWFVR